MKENKLEPNQGRQCRVVHVCIWHACRVAVLLYKQGMSGTGVVGRQTTWQPNLAQSNVIFHWYSPGALSTIEVL